MHCPQCQYQNSDTAKFCEECGARLVTACPQCGHQANPTAKFCAECGESLTGKSKSKSSPSKSQSLEPNVQSLVGERRQLTVMFCDLVDSTALSARLDPEDYQAVVRAYQSICTAVIQRYDGHMAQYLGDGLLVYFGYPTAHEDDAQRAVRAGLEMVTALRSQVPSPLAGEEKKKALQVRIGIHTGPVVVGEIGEGNRREQLALGETPNVAARLQGVAAPNTIVLSGATHRLVVGLFHCQDLGAQTVKGIATPVAMYQVLSESTVQHRLDAVLPTGLTPLVGREEELALLHRRWE
jgi:class 3 adenylate cyclase